MFARVASVAFEGIEARAVGVGKPDVDALVFSNIDGSPISPNYFSIAWGRAPGRAPDRPSLAVIPFHSLTRSEDGDLGCGVAGELVCELARNKDLRVIGRDSSFALASQPMRAQDLGEQLGVRYLV